MTAQKGSAFLVKMDIAVSGDPTYTTVGAMTSKSLKIDEEVVDVTNQDSEEKWRELLSGAGIRKISISGSGIHTKNAAIADGRKIVAAQLAQRTAGFKSWEVIVPGLGTFEGPFMITSYANKGPHDKEVAFDLSLESASAVDFTAET